MNTELAINLGWMLIGVVSLMGLLLWSIEKKNNESGSE